MEIKEMAKELINEDYEEDEVVQVDFTLDEIDGLIEEFLKLEDLLKNGTKYLEEDYKDDKNKDFYLRLHCYRLELIKNTLTKLMEKSQSWGEC